MTISTANISNFIAKIRLEKRVFFGVKKITLLVTPSFKIINIESDFKNNQYSQYVNWTGVESKLSSEYFDVGFRDYTDVMGI